MTTEVTATAPTNDSSKEMISDAKEEQQPPMRRVPKELDILPPRPVLFPWLPSVDALKNCCGTASTTKPNQGKKFSFDLSMGGKTFGKGALQPGTPVTAPLSPNSVDADDDMPDMSRMEEGTANRKHRPRQQHQQQQQQLGSLTDVIAEVLRVIFFLMSVKRAFLRNEAEGAQQNLPLHRKTTDKSTTSNNNSNNNSSNNADDEEIPRLSLSST